MSVFHKCWKTTARKKNILKNQTVKQETGYFDDLKENPLFFFFNHNQQNEFYFLFLICAQQVSVRFFFSPKC